MQERAGMRAGDSDRAVVAERLRLALEEGRLDLHEYDERLQRTYAAKTYGDLDGLLDDLPATVPPGQARLAPLGEAGVPVPAAEVPHPHAVRGWLVDTWDGYFGTVATVVGIWAVLCVMSQELLYFWPGWVAGPWGVVLLVLTVTGLVNGEPQRWAAKRAGKRQAKAEKRNRRRIERSGDHEAA
ncbi:DUF1707 SHOCT-like domain-containing protein [Plantactinospora sp. CA-290183]|uniref:DUF1707 SHOCT-like domain-containing protein n=1 Tax=Plantactinospora sp. CA-290183 TaxID=3240006 RepID=UPI003D8E4975